MRHASKPWTIELRALLGLALPLVAGNLAWSGIAATDLFLLGRIGPDAVAAGALALAIHNILFVFGLGLSSAASPLIAHARGQHLHAVRAIRQLTRAALQAVLLVSLPSWLLLWWAEPILLALGQAPRLAHAAGTLLHGLEWSLLPWLAFSVLRNFMSAVERPFWGMAVLCVGVPFNLLAGWALIFGHGGLPALGLFGAGLASTLSATAMVGALAAVLVIDRRFRRFRLFGRWWRAASSRLGQVARVGLPIAVAQTLEVAVFNAAVVVVGLFGAAPLAAHAAAIQLAALSFMVPLGISQAASVRVGLAFGAGDRVAVGLAGRTALGLGAAYAMVAGVVLLALPHPLLGLFLGGRTAGAEAIMALAIRMLAVAAMFQPFDCVQVIAAGALRGLQDTRLPMIFSAGGYWIVGLGAGLLLAFPVGLGAISLWFGLATGLGTVALLLLRCWCARDWLFSRRAPPGSPRTIATPA